jgi:PAS domain S-box-containing protein
MVADSAGYGMGISDIKGTIIYINQSLAQMHGYTIEELIGKHQSILHNEEQWKNVNRLIGQLMLVGNVVEEEIWCKRKDGTVFPTLMNGALIRDKKGLPLFMAGTVVDITKRKQAEEEIEKLLKAIETTKEAINIMDPDGRMVYTNEAMEKLFGYKKGELIGKSCSILNAGPKPEAVVKKIIDTLEKDGFCEQEIHNKRKDGTEFTTYASISSVKYEKGKVLNLITTQHDITERKKAEERLKASLEEKEVLLREIHHRVKNNLQALIYLIDLQTETIEDGSVLQMLGDLQGRARTIALVHEKLSTLSTP